MTTQPLKRCPCGQVPEQIRAYPAEDDYLHANAWGSCCEKWSITFHMKGTQPRDGTFEVRAEEAWNAAPRAKGLE